MKENILFILKVIGLSALLSIAVKYGGRYVPISATYPVVLTIVFAPVVVMAGIMVWKTLFENQSHANHR